MKYHHRLLNISCAGVGIVAGYLLNSESTSKEKSRNEPRQGVAMSSQHASDARSSATGTTTVSSATLLSKIPADHFARQEWLKNLDLRDSAHVIEAMAEQAGISGLDYTQRSTVDDVFERWNAADPQAALAWVMSLKNENNRGYFYNKVFEPLLESDPHRAQQLSLEIAQLDSSWDHKELMEDLAKAQLEHAWKQDHMTAESLLNIYDQYEWGNSTSGSELKHYPEDFDFQRFLDGIAEKTAKDPDHRQPAQMPSDLLKIWAMRQPQEALDWLCRQLDAGTSVSFQDSADIYVALLHQNGSAEAQQFLVDALNSKNQKLYEDALENIYPETLARALPQIAAGERKDEILRRIAANENDSNTSSFCHLVAQMSSNDAKIKYLSEFVSDDTGTIDKKVAKLTPAQWRQIGISPEQLKPAEQGHKR